MPKTEERITIYRIDPYRTRGRPVVESVDVIVKPKTLVPADGKRSFPSGFGYGMRLERERLGKYFFASREEAIRNYVEHRAEIATNNRDAANKSAREYIEAIEWATEEGVDVPGHSTPDVPDPAMRKPSGLDAAVDREKARAIGELADELGERAEEIDERLGELTASVVRAAAEIDRILDEREGKS